MAEITVRAIDSALAMEEVQKRLGDDALIISTQRIDGQIEITATDEEVIKPEKEIKPFILGDMYRQDNFSAVLDRKVGEAKSGTDRNASSDLYSEVTNKISKHLRAKPLMPQFGLTELFSSRESQTIVSCSLAPCLPE